MLTATPAEPGAIERLVERAGRAVPADSVAVARMAFGGLAFASSVRFLAKGWVEALYLAPEHHLSYPGFDWVTPWPAWLMYAHVASLALLGLAIAVGYRTRLSAALFTVGFVYVELIDASLYLNHYWFMTLMGVLMAVLPVGHHWSLDARAGRTARAPVVSAWVVWALRAQVGVVYAFAGVAKLNPDWLLDAQPLRLWLADHTSAPVVGPLLGEPLTAHAAGWAGAVFDLTIVGWLLWHRSRPAAYVVLVVFHAATGLLFPIGVFPWVMVLATLVFFDPDWPRRFVGFRGVAPAGARPPIVAVLARSLLVALAFVQIVLPLRHLAHDGNVRWNERGYELAWRVMVTEKAGFLEFVVVDPITDDTWEVGPEEVLTDWQVTQASIRPDLLRQTAVLIDDLFPGDVEVRAVSFVSMNGREAVPLVDPDVDLTAIGDRRWIEPAP